MANTPTPDLTGRQPRKPTTAFNFDVATRQLFRTPGGKPFAMRLWFWVTVFMSITLLIALPLLASPYMEFLSFNQKMQADPLIFEDPEEMMALWTLFKDAIPGYIIMAVGPWLAAIAGEGALYRRTFRNEEHMRLPLRFGRDEWRILGAQLCIYLLMTAAYFVAIILGVVTLGIGFIVTIPALIAALFLIPLRFSAAGALSVHDDAFRFKDSRAVTKHRAGTLFGVYIFMWVAGYVAVSIVQMLIMVIVTGSGEAVGMMAGTDAGLEAITGMGDRLRNPLIMIVAILGVIGYAATYAFWLLNMSGVGAYTVKWYHSGTDAEIFD